MTRRHVQPRCQANTPGRGTPPGAALLPQLPRHHTQTAAAHPEAPRERYQTYPKTLNTYATAVPQLARLPAHLHQARSSRPRRGRRPPPTNADCSAEHARRGSGQPRQVSRQFLGVQADAKRARSRQAPPVALADDADWDGATDAVPLPPVPVPLPLPVLAVPVLAALPPPVPVLPVLGSTPEPAPDTPLIRVMCTT
jgi:hypothetical protein